MIDRKINYLLFTFYIFLDFIGLSFIQGAPKKGVDIISRKVK